MHINKFSWGSLTDSQMPVIFKNYLEIPKHQLDDIERKGPAAHHQHIEWAFLQAKKTNMLKGNKTIRDSSVVIYSTSSCSKPL